jgi:hypothetical protein
MVTSVTNMALLVQSGGLVGMGVPTVGVALGSVPDVTVADAAVTAVPSAGAAVVSVAAGASVVEAGAAVVPASVAAGARGSVAIPPPLQADKASANSAVTVNSFLIILGLLCHHIEPDLWNCCQLAVILKHHDLRF